MPPSLRKNGQYIQADFFENLAGLNNTDSPFRVLSSQAVAGYNYDYLATGGFAKRAGHSLLNATPDTQLRTLGFALHNTVASVKTMLRAAGTKLQTFNTTTGVTTNVVTDAVVPSSDVFSTNQPVVSSQFNTPSINTTWFAGGGLTGLLGYNGTAATQNGSSITGVGGSLSLTPSGTDGTLPAGTYYYSVALIKTSTGAVSNAGLDKSVVVAATNHVAIDLSGLTGIDTTKYSQIRIYRSAIAGVSGFTTGDLVVTQSSSLTSYTDLGAVQLTAGTVPRSGSTSLDNSVLPTGTCNVITTWKRRLVTAIGSTLYVSDLNKPESWPSLNFIQIPSGGAITGLAIISYSTDTTTSTDEFLVIFKEREVWVLSGSSVSDWTLKFVDYVGCVNQPLIVFANGFLAWIDYRGIYLWDGSGKPIYCSRPIEYDFGVNGDIDRSNLALGCGGFFRKQNEIVWTLSSIALGEQKLCVKMDLRLTLPNMANALAGRILEGVFIKDSLANPMYALLPTLPNYDETFYAGDNAGYIYKLFDNFNSDNGTGIAFRYRTKSEDFGLIGTTKRYHKIVVWALASTVNNLTLNYWVDYRTDVTHQGASQQAAVATGVTGGVWDQGTWDSAYWDSNVVTYVPIVYNLQDPIVGTEGDALTLEFNQVDANAQVVIAGYSVFFTEAGMRK